MKLFFTNNINLSNCSDCCRCDYLFVIAKHKKRAMDIIKERLRKIKEGKINHTSGIIISLEINKQFKLQEIDFEENLIMNMNGTIIK